MRSVDTNPTAELLTASMAAEFVGRSLGSVRGAIKDGTLESLRCPHTGGTLIRRDTLLRWHAEHPPRPATISGTYHRTADALAALGPSSADALSVYLGIHPGNVRKHLAQLARLGRAQRDTEGLWVLTDADVGAA